MQFWPFAGGYSLIFLDTVLGRGVHGTLQHAADTTSLRMEKSKWISYRLRRNVHFNNTFNPTLRCPLGERAFLEGKGNRKRFSARRELPLEMKSALDFVTTISTNLKIVVMGDSVGIQVAQGLEEASGASHQHRTVLRPAWGPPHETMAVSAPVEGGGVIASWRIIGMLKRESEGKPLPNNYGGGWLRKDARKLLNYSFPINGSEPSLKTIVGSIDVFIFRIMHGWLDFSEITEELLQETVEVAHEVLGVKTVIFITIPFSNNVKTEQDIIDMHRTNDMIRNFSRAWQSGETGVDHILVQDYGKFTHELIERNAQVIGMNISTGRESYMLRRLNSHRKYPLSIAHGCARIPRMHDAPLCDRNQLTRDGMHPCLEALGGRIIASLACLLGCVYNHHETESEHGTVFIRSCEQGCNNRFMSLMPVDDSLIDSEGGTSENSTNISSS